jgi:MtN3 and saliva related transmembrane protein
MVLAEIIGVGAAILTTASFVPQAVKVVRTRETAAISLAMYAMFTIGVALWLVYGFMTAQWIIVSANGVTLLFAVVILTIKLGEGARARRSKQAR